jgi:hypothetical protein
MTHTIIFELPYSHQIEHVHPLLCNYIGTNTKPLVAKQNVHMEDVITL